MAIGQLYTQRDGWTILQLGPATASNYRRSAKMTRMLLALTRDKAERSVINSMVAECEYVVDWLESGRRPGSLRGIEQGYVQSWDPAWLDSYYSPNGWKIERETSDLSDRDRFRIEEAMHDLTVRERQCYLLHVVDGMSFKDIAMELHIGKSSVQTTVERARAKIEEAKVSSLFLVE